MNEDSVSFMSEQCARAFRRRVLVLQPDDALDYCGKDWADTIVVVERGELEVECCSGTRACFVQGDVLSFANLTLRRLRNAGQTPLVLSGLSRQR